MDNWSSENINKFKKFFEIVNRGARVNGTEITELYNSVLNKSLKPTNCSSCISQRYREVKTSYRAFEAELKQQEEKAKALEVLDELLTPTEEELNENNPKKRGRTKKGE